MKNASLTKTFFFLALPAAFLVVLTVFLGLELYNHLTTSKRFAVREVELLTVGPANKEEVIRRANIKTGTNIFLLDLGEVRKNVERDPWVASATVSRALPDKIQIRYEQQKPVAILSLDSMYYLNAAGVPFTKLEKGASLEYPLIHVDSTNRPEDLNPKRLQNALDFLRALDSYSPIRSRDVGDLTIRGAVYGESSPLLLTYAFPPSGLDKKGAKPKQKRLHFTLTAAEEDFVIQAKRANAVMRYLVQQGKNPRLIRLELGKKVVVKVE